jgi:metal-responsive CopG/Arc/MetJ family transcriptional regulator
LPRVRISITLEKKVLERLDEEVAKTGSSRSLIINQLLRKYFEMGYVLSR